jgi:aromatic ring-opening dioxygenase catalytic subunit (LigB family)
VAEIVGAFGVPHNPHFPTWVTNGHPLAGEIARLYGALRDAYEHAAPDTLVYITSDHYNLFWESLPIFAIAVAESAHGASDYPELDRDLRLDAALGRHVQAHVVDAGFDVGMVQELELDHTVIAPLHFLAPDADVALVPVFINGFIRPLPSAQRCFALGRAIRDALETAPGSARVAVVASGSFSLEIGGPRISEDSHTGVPDPAWMERVLELLRAGDVERLVAEATDEQIWRAGNAGGEVLDWIAMLATIDPRPPTVLDAQPQFGHAYAAWTP